MTAGVRSLSRRGMFRTVAACSLLTATVLSSSVLANNLAGRHYYGGWNYYPARTYYYSHYYYKPYATYEGYRHHYCVYYHSSPRYVYYYNPVSRVYWGRYDLKEKGYSLLAEKDRKEDLKSIPETAFPKPGQMPPIPESDDGERILPIDPATLPAAEAPKDAPAR